ncbi:EamA family transporter [Aneurinibacillus sp. XH2]|uniref:EamA family transporter n=1 Tax=Aneurinibacillus sp. XH2 TaxID=1450761 RepID=UPI002FFA7FA4
MQKGDGVEMVYWRSVLLVFLGACSYGILSTFVKLAYQAGFVPAEVSGSQMFLAMTFMWTVALLFSKPRLKKKHWPVLMGIGVMSGLTGVFYYQSLQYVPASIAIVLLFQFTWIGVLAEAVMERRRPGWEKIGALVLLAIGTVLAGGIFSSTFGELKLIGVVYGLLSAFTYAMFVIFSGKASEDLHPYTRSAVILTGSVLVTFLVYPPVFLINGAFAEGLLVYSLLLALFGGVIPTLFFTLGVPHIGGGLATILGAAELPMAVFMSNMVLKESVSAWQWFGVAVILLGIAVPEIARKCRAAVLQKAD